MSSCAQIYMLQNMSHPASTCREVYSLKYLIPLPPAHPTTTHDILRCF
eukprot:UN02202